MQIIGKIDSILVVIVLYKQSIVDSVSYRSLINSLNVDEIPNLELFIYDNSPSSNYEPPQVKMPHVYKNNPLNPGISKAYNEALDYARGKNKKWLLLFDQDTEVNRDYLISSFYYSEVFADNNDVVAIVPQIYGLRKEILSPCKVLFPGYFIPIKICHPQLLKGRTTAINSGILLKTVFLENINGFSDTYPLDMLDHWMFAQIFKKGKKVFCHAKSIEHDLSVVSDRYMDNDRYAGFLVAEKRYYLDEGKFSFLFYKIMLLLRIMRRLFNGQMTISRLTWDAFINKM